MITTNEPSSLSIDTANQLHRTALKLFRLLRDTRTANGLTPAKLGVLGRLYRGGTPPQRNWPPICASNRNP